MAAPTETDDVVALWRLQARYADVITRRAWPELRELFLARTGPTTEVLGLPAGLGPLG